MKLKYTPTYILTLLCATALYDFSVVYFFPKAPSISQFFQSMHHRAPFVVIVLAICAGHLLFPTVKYKGDEE